ncbi:hypothetical protein AAES_06937 [Amazona aestiva]|uniref:Retroviral nucleocapsid Gag protein p24 C-terminal domain-containing protein n=1 Tax=Amazona aestiva TaxID=12930 RepID=A0A0Q3X9Z8_AMAAE|nr:hypothetical protein AAES_06937 [Amazona aestiva]
MQFTDRLETAIDKQVENDAAKDALLLKLAIENANPDRQKGLRMLTAPTLIDMIEAYEDHFSPEAGAAVDEMTRGAVFVAQVESQVPADCFHVAMMIHWITGAPDTSVGVKTNDTNHSQVENKMSLSGFNPNSFPRARCGLCEQQRNDFPVVS